MTKNKSLLLTYIFSLLGGLFGLHHIYLGRTQHALLWITTFGGFGIGYIYEFLFSLRRYVKEANEEDSILNEYKLKMMRRKTPSFEIRRFCGQFLTAVFYGFMTYYAFPETWHESSFSSLFIGFCTSISIAFGTRLVGTIGPRQCSFIWPLLGALFGMPFLVSRVHSSPSFNLSALLSSLFFEWKIEWNLEYFSSMFILKPMDHCTTTVSKQKQSKRPHIMKRFLICGLGLIVFSIVFTSAICQNVQINIDGRQVKIKDALVEFFTSEQFLLLCQRLSMLMRQLWTFYLQYGFKTTWRHIWRTVDMENEKQAYEVLYS